MLNYVIDKIRKFNEVHPYLASILIFVAASLIGITIQYLIDGKIIGSGFYTTTFIAIVSLLLRWLKRAK